MVSQDTGDQSPGSLLRVLDGGTKHCTGVSE